MTDFIYSIANGRILIVSLDKGELVLETIADVLKKHCIKSAAMISGIGTLRKAVYHMITTTEDHATNRFVTLEGPMELSSVQGLVLEGEPHFHMVFSDLERVYSGHLEPGCEVQYLAEFVLLEFQGEDLRREKTEGGFSRIVSNL